jgi:hypothetical protein
MPMLRIKKKMFKGLGKLEKISKLAKNYVKLRVRD